MLHVRVDGETFGGADTVGTLSDVLDLVEPRLAARSRIVTAFRINGVDEPAFREAAVRARFLEPGDLLDLSSTTAGQLAFDALTDTVRLMPSLGAAATQIARQLRRPEGDDVAREFAGLAEGLTLLVTLVQAAEAWADAAGIPRTSWLGRHVVDVARCIDALEASRRDEDWVTTADVLDFDLVAALEAWRADLEDAVTNWGEPSTAAGIGAHATEA